MTSLGASRSNLREAQVSIALRHAHMQDLLYRVYSIHETLWRWPAHIDSPWTTLLGGDTCKTKELRIMARVLDIDW